VGDIQQTFDDLSQLDFVRNLGQRELEIIRLLDEGYYQAYIARVVKTSPATVNKFVKRLVKAGLIQETMKDPLHRRATSYAVGDKLKSFLKNIPRPGEYTLLDPHFIRFKYPILDQNKPISITVNRFAAARTKYLKPIRLRGGDRLHFHVRMPHGTMGIIVHPTQYHPSIEVMVVDRPHVLARTEEEVIGIISTELQSAISRFVQEQSWEGVILSLGDPQQEGVIHHALPSKMAKALIEKGKQITMEGFKVDDSLLKKMGAKGVAHIETPIQMRANEVDGGLRAAIKLDQQLPQMIKSMEDNISTAVEKQKGQITEMEKAVDNMIATRLSDHLKSIDSVIAHAMSGTTIDQTLTRLLNVMGNMFARQGEQDKEIRELRGEIEKLRKGGGTGKGVRQTQLPF